MAKKCGCKGKGKGKKSKQHLNVIIMARTGRAKPMTAKAGVTKNADCKAQNKVVKYFKEY